MCIDGLRAKLEHEVGQRKIGFCCVTVTALTPSQISFTHGAFLPCHNFSNHRTPRTDGLVPTPDAKFCEHDAISASSAARVLVLQVHDDNISAAALISCIHLLSPS